MLIYDTGKYNNEPIIHLLSDLEACYNRQLPEIGEIVEEVLGVNRKVIKVITKTISTFKHFVCTGFGISIQYYSRKHERLVGTRQEMASGEIYCDQSLLISKSWKV